MSRVTISLNNTPAEEERSSFRRYFAAEIIRRSLFGSLFARFRPSPPGRCSARYSGVRFVGHLRRFGHKPPFSSYFLGVVGVPPPLLHDSSHHLGRHRSSHYFITPCDEILTAWTGTSTTRATSWMACISILYHCFCETLRYSPSIH